MKNANNDGANQETKVEAMETKETVEGKFEWRGKNFSFFNNNKCEFFPCHKTDKPDEFNCLFCYCPLFALKDKCGGNFKYTENGIKDCSSCKLPHVKESYGYITGKFSELVEITKLG